jgi:hypothetical protein
MGGMDWIDVAQDRDRWWAVVNAVMNLAEELLAFHEGLCSMELVMYALNYFRCKMFTCTMTYHLN